MRREPLSVVVAGGRSRRMGSDKAFLEVGGRELLERALEAATGATRDVLLVVRSPSRFVAAVDRYAAGGETRLAWPERVAVVPDPRPGCGPLAGLEAAADRAPGRPVWLLACDMPFVTADVGRELLGELAGLRATEGTHARPAAVVPRAGGRAHPLCAAYAGGAAPLARSLLEEGHRDVQGLLRRLAVRWMEEEARENRDRAHVLHNVNRPADLERARRVAAV